MGPRASAPPEESSENLIFNFTHTQYYYLECDFPLKKHDFPHFLTFSEILGLATLWRPFGDPFRFEGPQNRGFLRLLPPRPPAVRGAQPSGGILREE